VKREVRRHLQAEMAAFDSLPLSLRELVREWPVHLGAMKIRRTLDYHGEQSTLQLAEGSRAKVSANYEAEIAKATR
jgi:hypothetical protein